MYLKKEFRLPFIVIGTVFTILAMLLVFFIVLDHVQKQKNRVEFQTKAVAIPYEEKTIESWTTFDDRPPEVIQVGVEGLMQEKWRIEYGPNGEKLSEVKIDESIILEKKNKISRRGMLNRVLTKEKVQAVALEAMQAFQANKLESLYPLLSERDVARFSLKDLQTLVTALNLSVDSFAFTDTPSFEVKEMGDINTPEIATSIASMLPTSSASHATEVSYSFPTVLNEVTTNNPIVSPEVSLSPTPLVLEDSFSGSSRLIAKIPMEIRLFMNITEGHQIKTELMLIQESKNEWKVRYPGPTHLVKVGKQQTQDDGGKTIGYPLSYTINLQQVVMFRNSNVMFFDFELKNTTIPSESLERALIAKSAALLQLTPTATPYYVGKEPVFATPDRNFRLYAQLELVNASVKDNVGTKYTFIEENVVSEEKWETIPPGKVGKSWVKFQPAPSEGNDTILLTVQCNIGTLHTFENNFGTILFR